jgi:hypothetical protein
MHDKMLRSWITPLQAEPYGYTNVLVDLPGTNERPAQVGTSIPDLTAMTRNRERVIGEVKTSNDIDNDHTRGQLSDYARTGAKIMLLVPKDSKPIADQVCQKWGFGQVQVWTYG